ncbi:hypothetical protein J7K24_01660 [bacterium]|nr:hypothetical protein [bacterium]
MKKTLLIISILLFCLFGFVNWSNAGFGITPPDIINEHLVPGSSFEETIYLTRGDPDEELTAQVIINDSPIKDWITIEKGERFPLPKGKKIVPMKVLINVPSGAEYGKYKGTITIKAVPSKNKGGQVSTILAGTVDIELLVTQETFSDFKVKIISIPSEIEQNSPLVISIKLENLGNQKTRPSKVHLDIYDLYHKKILKSEDVYQFKGWVEPFQTGIVEAQSLLDLDLGEYWADISVYKGEEKVDFAKVYFKIVPQGSKPVSKMRRSLFSYFPPTLVEFISLLIVLIIGIIIALLLRKKPRKRKRKI